MDSLKWHECRDEQRLICVSFCPASVYDFLSAFRYVTATAAVLHLHEHCAAIRLV